MILVATRNPSRPLRTVESVSVPYPGAVFVRIDGVPRNVAVPRDTTAFDVELAMARAVADAESNGNHD